MDQAIELMVNGAKRTVEAGPDDFLLEVLRDDLGLTGSKFGCGEGECGACTVLVDGAHTKSCILPLSAVEGKAIRTIESLASGDKLHPLQEAFVEEDAMQCGYCVSGMLMAAYALLEKIKNPSERDIRDHMRGNICRCCAYPRMVKAIQRAAKALAQGESR
jgi:aerobic-type carbon monoxide dehydrogenase small subunit (CoxS/CutS family)